MILHRRSQLMKWLEENAPTASIRRAVGEGSVELLGFFFALPGSKSSGWVIQIGSSITNLVWWVVVKRHPNGISYYAWILNEDILWQHWNLKNSDNPFMQGDNPEIYRKNRENAQTQRCPTLHQKDISA